ncbi:MAG: pantetheine-phosphate adenylyltransferase [Bacteroidales bacterium]|nr:pantetheine-phosphate adenylyltransferase [Bacteroidales bacterium]MCL2133917.1 pantetheine-phosphate adenylyltransferase [Bacteroidales bacterium]
MTAFFPGSFDPFTAGHYDVVCRALKIFDRIIIGVGVNSSKKTLFSEEERILYAGMAVKSFPQVSVVGYDELTVDFCRANNISTIIRGIRSTADYDYENTIALANHFMNNAIDTIYFPAYPEHSFICSSVVRDIYKHGGDVSGFLPEGVELKQQ